MFKTLFASVGIGAAKVDTVLQTEHLVPGQPFQADIIIRGGDVAQDLSGLELALMTKIKVETEEGVELFTHELQNWSLADTTTIEPGQEIRVPFRAELPSETPVTELPVDNNQCVVWLTTGLSIDRGLDASDKDYLHIHPNKVMQRCMAVMDELGYRMNKADVEKGYLSAAGFRSVSGCYQELEYHPGAGGFLGGIKGGVQEVELSFVPAAEETHLLIELDRAFRGDGYVSLTIPHTEAGLSSVHGQLEHLLS